MSISFEELDFRPTPMGVLSLRRRRRPMSDLDVYEIKLGDEFLMSSQFTVAEIELARLGLAALGRRRISTWSSAALGSATPRGGARKSGCAIIDRGRCACRGHRVASSRDCFRSASQLTDDPRCRLVNGDFFAMSYSAEGFDQDAPGRCFDAVLVDIDHSPRNLLHPRHAALYEPEGLARLAGHLHPGGVFALWSNDPPDDAFERVLADAFATPRPMS